MEHHETFWTLVTDLPHWQFELFVEFVTTVIIGILIWPPLKRFFTHHRTDDERMEALELEVFGEVRKKDEVHHKHI